MCKSIIDLQLQRTNQGKRCFQIKNRSDYYQRKSMRIKEYCSFFQLSSDVSQIWFTIDSFNAKRKFFNQFWILSSSRMSISSFNLNNFFSHYSPVVPLSCSLYIKSYIEFGLYFFKLYPFVGSALFTGQ